MSSSWSILGLFFAAVAAVVASLLPSSMKRRRVASASDSAERLLLCSVDVEEDGEDGRGLGGDDVDVRRSRCR